VTGARYILLSTEPTTNRLREHAFFASIALLIVAAVFIGFARTYYLAGVFRAPLPSLLVHIHGAVFSIWILLLLAQVSLVAAGRVDVQRCLGLAGCGVACTMVILGQMVATDALARHFTNGPKGEEVKAFYAVPVNDVLAFATLAYLGFRARFSPATHKRLMLIATIALLDAAFVRWPIAAPRWNLRCAEMCCYALLLFLAGYDLWSTKRVHRATLWASGFLVLLQQVRIPIGHSVSWQRFATTVQDFARSLY
jgi:hypothetical protein